MNAPPTSPPFWTPRTAIGFVAFFTGVAFAGYMLHADTLTGPALALCFIVSGAGMYVIEPTIMAGYVGTVRDVAQEIRAGRHAIGVHAPAATAVVVDRPDAPTAVVPPVGPPTEVRADTPVTQAVAAVEKRKRRPKVAEDRREDRVAPPVVPIERRHPDDDEPPGLSDEEIAARLGREPDDAGHAGGDDAGR